MTPRGLTRLELEWRAVLDAWLYGIGWRMCWREIVARRGMVA